MQENRRGFLKQSGKGIAGTALGTFLIQNRSESANDTIHIGVVGIGGRGSSLTRGFAREKNVKIAYLCDPDMRRGEDLHKMLKDEHNPSIKKISNYKEIIDDKNVDALIVATPDHWHAIPTIEACQAGKDVYVEKPASHNIWEGRKMVEAARKYKRVVQVGTQSRSAPYVHKAIDYLRSGKLGTIHLCKIYNLKSGRPFKLAPMMDAPDEVNWSLWLGPADLRPYRGNIMNKGWLFLWDFCGGDMGNDGIHQIDLARMLIDQRTPKAAHCTGGNYAFDDHRQVPDTQVAAFDFDDMVVTFENTQYAPYMAKTPMLLRESDTFPYWPQNSTRIELYGTEGLMIIGRHGGGWQVFTNDGEVVEQAYGRFPDAPHRENFLQCVRTRQRPNADIEEGHLSAIMVHTGNIAYRTGRRKVIFDGENEKFVDDERANMLLKREYREPYVIPEEV